jgi:hypothetical protein
MTKFAIFVLVKEAARDGWLGPLLIGLAVATAVVWLLWPPGFLRRLPDPGGTVLAFLAGLVVMFAGSVIVLLAFGTVSVVATMPVKYAVLIALVALVVYLAGGPRRLVLLAYLKRGRR